MATKDITDAQVCKAYADIKKIQRDHDVAEAIKCAVDINHQRAESPWVYDLLAGRTGQPVKVCYRAMERAERRGLVDYGVSLRTGFLTEQGRALLAV